MGQVKKHGVSPILAILVCGTVTMHGESKSSILGGFVTSLSNSSHFFNMLVFSITLGLILTSMSPKLLFKKIYGTVPHAM